MGHERRGQDWICNDRLDCGLGWDDSSEMARRATLGSRVYFGGKASRTY